MIVASTWKYSANPPQTPNSILLVVDLINLLSMVV
jgi:hypothetical protein